MFEERASFHEDALLVGAWETVCCVSEEGNDTFDDELRLRVSFTFSVKLSIVDNEKEKKEDTEQQDEDERP